MDIELHHTKADYETLVRYLMPEDADVLEALYVLLSNRPGWSWALNDEILPTTLDWEFRPLQERHPTRRCHSHREYIVLGLPNECRMWTPQEVANPAMPEDGAFIAGTVAELAGALDKYGL